jgi:glyoxylase-like metal-dependent hydrolase (beta-lactamase superfamily II)
VEVLTRQTPAAHAVRVGSVLVDTGSAHVAPLAAFLGGWRPDLVVLTHGHGDHVGGAAWLAAQGVPVAMHRADVATVAEHGAWLDQPVAPFPVARELADGDLLPEGLEVLHVPAQTPGHIALWHPASRTVLTGDLLQAHDVAWLPVRPGTLDDAIAAMARLADLGAVRGIPGHGPPVDDVPAAAARTVAVYEAWREEPARQAGHAVRRLAAAWVALCDPAPTAAEAVAGLSAVPALVEYAAVLGDEPGSLAAALLAGLRERGALLERQGRLVPGFPHEAPAPRPGR